MEDASKYLAHIMLNNEYIARRGFIRSLVEQKVVDADGNPIPWYAYPAIDVLQNRSALLKDLTVFEYGCGFGTLWWAKRSRRVTILEHDRNWFEKMTPQFPENVRPIYRELKQGGEYCMMPVKLEPIRFNIIIIDGRDRVNCCLNCVDALTEDGLIIFDNSNRDEYIPGRDFLKHAGFRELQLFGMTPMVPILENATSFFYRSGNCLDL